MKLLICDMDGVIFQGINFWLDLHRAMGTQDEALDLWERMGRRQYRVLSRRTATLWRGRSAEPYFELIRNRQYVPGAQSLLRFAHSRNARTAIISSGAYHLAQRAQSELGVERIYANKLGIDRDGLFDGSVDVQVDNNHKLMKLRELRREFGIAREDTVVVGDTESDGFMAEEAGLCLGYDVAEDVSWRFDHLLPEGMLAGAIPYLAAHSSASGAADRDDAPAGSPLLQQTDR